MFKVEANTLREYFAFDPARSADLRKLDALIAEAAPGLKRYFHKGTPAGSAGMRFKMIGYGRFEYAIKSGKTTPWPVVGVALQRNYISVYVSTTRPDGSPPLAAYPGLGEKRRGRFNFSFVKFEELDAGALARLLAEVDSIFKRDPANPVRPMQGERGPSLPPRSWLLGG